MRNKFVFRILAAAVFLCVLTAVCYLAVPEAYRKYVCRTVSDGDPADGVESTLQQPFLDDADRDRLIASALRRYFSSFAEPITFSVMNTQIMLSGGKDTLVYTVRAVDADGFAGLVLVYIQPRWQESPVGQPAADTIAADTAATAESAAEDAVFPLSAVFADEESLRGVTYLEHTVTQSEYTQRLLFRTNAVLTDIRFTSMDYTEEGFRELKELYVLDSLTPDKPLVLGVVFPGDLTTYGFSFTDSAGEFHQCLVYLSGKDGNPYLQEYTPSS